MKKQSYVNAKDIHKIPFAILRHCWRDNDLHLEDSSYQMLVSELWQQNIAQLRIQLQGHGIFQRGVESIHVEDPAFEGGGNRSTSKDHQRPARPSALSEPASILAPLPTPYGTFIRISQAPPMRESRSAPHPVTQGYMIILI